MTAIHHTAARGFDAAADAYRRARPGYPDAAVDHVVRALGVEADALVVDLAAGTGKLTAALVERGLRCLAVEPVAGMRQALARSLPGVPVLAGTAEAMPLREGTAAGVTIAQALHWFDLDRALAEIHRVLAPGACMALVWNARDERQPWVAELTKLIDPYEGDVRIHRHRRGLWRAPLAASPLFETVGEIEVDHEQEVDEDLLVDRVASTSFVAVLADDERSALLERVRALARTHPDLAGRARFPFPYVCEVSIHRARPA